jgi:DNA-directed RNA polymerase specialized sigma24 family protein
MIHKREFDLEKLNVLIPELAESSQNAWDEFVKLTSNDLHIYICYFLHDAEHAADILQEVYLLFLLNISIFSKVCKEETEEIATKKIYAWLYKTSKNKSLNVIKKKEKWNNSQFFSISEKILKTGKYAIKFFRKERIK